MTVRQIQSREWKNNPASLRKWETRFARRREAASPALIARAALKEFIEGIDVPLGNGGNDEKRTVYRLRKLPAGNDFADALKRLAGS